MENDDGQYGNCGHRAHGGLTTVVAYCLQFDDATAEESKCPKGKTK